MSDHIVVTVAAMVDGFVAEFGIECETPAIIVTSERLNSGSKIHTKAIAVVMQPAPVGVSTFAHAFDIAASDWDVPVKSALRDWFVTLQTKIESAKLAALATSAGGREPVAKGVTSSEQGNRRAVTSPGKTSKRKR